MGYSATVGNRSGRVLETAVVGEEVANRAGRDEELFFEIAHVDVAEGTGLHGGP